MKLNKVQDLFHALEVVLSAEDKEKLAQISQAYFATVDENFTLREKNYELHQLLIGKDIQISELNDKLEERQKLILDTGNGKKVEYYLQINDEQKIGPVCPCCYKKDGSTVILASTSKDHAICSNCKAKFVGVDAIIEGKKAMLF